MRQIEFKRKLLNISIRQIAKQLNINERTYKKIEAEDGFVSENVGYNTLKKLSKILNIEINQLLKNPEINLEDFN